MPTIATLFTTILTCLRAAIGAQAALRSANPAHAARDRARTALLVVIWGRVGRLATRFEKLFARWRTGTLPKPCRSRAGESRTRREKPSLPAGHAWLVVVMGHQAVAAGSQLQHLLAHPDMAEFLHAAPQAGRILRPLCHMLGISPPTQPKPAQPEPTQPRAQPNTPSADTRTAGHKSPAPPLRFSPA